MLNAGYRGRVLDSACLGRRCYVGGGPGRGGGGGKQVWGEGASGVGGEEGKILWVLWRY